MSAKVVDLARARAALARLDELAREHPHAFRDVPRIVAALPDLESPEAAALAALAPDHERLAISPSRRTAPVGVASRVQMPGHDPGRTSEASESTGPQRREALRGSPEPRESHHDDRENL